MNSSVAVSLHSTYCFETLPFSLRHPTTTMTTIIILEATLVGTWQSLKDIVVSESPKKGLFSGLLLGRNILPASKDIQLRIP